MRIALTKGRSMSAGNVRWYHGRGLGIGVGGAVGKTFAIVGGFFGFASVFFSVVGMLKSKGLYTVVSLAGNSLGATIAALGVVYAASS